MVCKKPQTRKIYGDVKEMSQQLRWLQSLYFEILDLTLITIRLNGFSLFLALSCR